jgi:hypothetical protein
MTLIIGFVGGYVAAVYSWDKVKAFYAKVKAKFSKAPVPAPVVPVAPVTPSTTA